jgi:FkbM family methyltransferase
MLSLASAARQFCSYLRFGESRVAHWVFGAVGEQAILSRPMFGSRLFIDVSRDLTHQMLYLTGERCIPERCLVNSLLRPGMHVIDVGANIGYYLSMFEKGVGSKGFVTCIEPSSENLIELYANIRHNGWTNVAVHECAVGDVSGTVGLRPGVNTGVIEAGDAAATVPVCRLDDLIANRCDLLKIDVEGYEGHVFRGAISIIERDRPTIFLEYHPKLVRKYGGCLSELLSQIDSRYRHVRFFDVPCERTLFDRFQVQYLGRSPIREVDISEISEEKLHEGRLHGTFWIVATNES